MVGHLHRIHNTQLKYCSLLKVDWQLDLPMVVITETIYVENYDGMHKCMHVCRMGSGIGWVGHSSHHENSVSNTTQWFMANYEVLVDARPLGRVMLWRTTSFSSSDLDSEKVWIMNKVPTTSITKFLRTRVKHILWCRIWNCPKLKSLWFILFWVSCF